MADKFLPKGISWFRLPEYLQELRDLIENNPGGSTDYSKVSETDVGGIATGDTVGPTLSDAMDQLLSLPATNVAVGYSINPSTFEKGLTTTSFVGTYTITLNTDTVLGIKLFQDTTEFDQAPNVGNGNETFANVSASSGPDLTTRIEVTAVSGIKTITRTMNFYAPTYSGSMDFADSANPVLIQALDKLIRPKGNLGIQFSPVLQRYVYAYPASYGDLSEIRDASNFNVTASFVKTVINFTLADATTEAMNVYVSDADTTQTNFTNTFIF